jgi:hypothetical protein
MLINIVIYLFNKVWFTIKDTKIIHAFQCIKIIHIQMISFIMLDEYFIGIAI